MGVVWDTLLALVYAFDLLACILVMGDKEFPVLVHIYMWLGGIDISNKKAGYNLIWGHKIVKISSAFSVL
jgi:hypothetical protein